MLVWRLPWEPTLRRKMRAPLQEREQELQQHGVCKPLLHGLPQNGQGEGDG